MGRNIIGQPRVPIWLQTPKILNRRILGGGMREDKTRRAMGKMICESERGTVEI